MIRLKSLLTEQEEKHYITRPEAGLESFYVNVDDVDINTTKLYWRDCAGITFEMSANDKQKLERVNEKLLRFTSLPEDEGTVNNSTTGEPEKLTLRKCVLGITNQSKWDSLISKKPGRANVAIMIE